MRQAAHSVLAQPLPPMSMPAFAWGHHPQLPGIAMPIPLHLLAASYMAYPNSAQPTHFLLPLTAPPSAGTDVCV